MYKLKHWRSLLNLNVYICHMTSLYNQIIFGPIHSRRLGLSLGVNLLPITSKLCSFDCIYCECGWNADHRGQRRFNTREEVRSALKAALEQMVQANTLPDVITFAGNGEPTLHPHFEQIIADTLQLRDQFCPTAKVSVLSNATQLGREDVHRALLQVDNNILKLDSALDATVQIINQPAGNYRVKQVVEQMQRFDGKMILQTMFLSGQINGHAIDNTTEVEVEAWLHVVEQIRPSKVMVYSLDRDTPCTSLQKAPREVLQRIASRVEQLGITCSVA
jgi:wyosine [tRNA(Phe)-imidazoG37] synthetase (radical SAM superfamily)